ncbi:hypothetical protein HELRODRAFT_173666 [Helobdella robusta]|uniref:Uncharacterized protein n=1 Tax=Helobdella robusta TaxID=6412 RepID=T1F737_HELRO|nr:hypothetical protein HELRODRAFT_173666 [Helobdella robusta]ESO03375.1 hypothetical protein HELRODRAFT_173666 [Helobdella robusta]
MAPPLNWENLMKINVDSIGDDDSTDLYNSLIEFDPKSETDPDKLTKLFRVTQAVLIVKGVEVEEMVNHLKEQASEDGKKTAQRNQELEDLKFELQSLRKKNKELEVDVHLFSPIFSTLHRQ